MPISRQTRVKQSPFVIENLLRDVGRSFYLSLRVLPEKLRHPLGTTYLFARLADTVADTCAVSREVRLAILNKMYDSLSQKKSLSALHSMFAQSMNADIPERDQNILHAWPGIAGLYEKLPHRDKTLSRKVLINLIQGMILDLSRFPLPEENKISALNSAQQLDEYIYHVAGCVGEYWTETLMAHLKAFQHWDKSAMIELGVRYGKALQLTNVLRDLSRDLRMGRCYLPLDQLQQHRISLQDLGEHRELQRCQPVIHHWFNMAMEYYRSAERYYLAIPRRCVRIRLSCLWPMLIGLATLAKMIAQSGSFISSSPVKVTRLWVYRMLVVSLCCFYSNGLCRFWIGRLRKNVKLN